MNNDLKREWFIANGIGGYACGSLSGIPLRRYHSLLNAALPAPFGRMIMMNYMQDKVIINEKEFLLSHIEIKGGNNEFVHYLTEFKMVNGIPYWKYKFEDVVIEKSLFLIYRQNTLCLTYKILESPYPVQIQCRPFLHFRMNESLVNEPIPNEKYTVQIEDLDCEITCAECPPLRIFNESSPQYTFDYKVLENVFYELEAKRGYASTGNLSSPGFFSLTLEKEEGTTFIISTETWQNLKTIRASDAARIENWRKKTLLKTAGPITKNPLAAQLILAADQFIFTPVTRFRDMTRLQAAGEEVKSIIAGFPWFTDWGRDTMISLEGLTLSTGRFKDACAILHTFSYYVKDGLIPNMFPEGEHSGLYNTADATLWYFHAIDRYVEVTGDEEIIEFLLPKLDEIIKCHLKGTLFGIHVDEDGLLMQGEPDLALTWMDAKMGNWVVTPRRGKAVEINALWYNALRLYEKWKGKKLDVADLCYDSFNQKFWNKKEECLYDVIDGDNLDSAIRPNQIFAISLTYPVLKQDRWESIIKVVQNDLLTPVGLRTLSPSHQEYKSFYDGDLQARDASYHQGTIWPWLIGHYVDAWLKVYPEDKASAQAFVQPLLQHLNSDCLGTIGEIFDATHPHHARGCFAQAWSVAELLRSCVKTEIF